jgi:alginate O-acetyltransferase complex protein AlgJ
MDTRAVTGDLRPEDIEAVFREFLGRAATAGDVAVWMQVGSLRTFLDGVLASEEYARRVATRVASEQSQSRAPFLNCWIAGWERFARPPGDLSSDGVVIVGTSGHLFIHGGSNHNLAAQRGEVDMAPDWLEEWRGIVTGRLDHAQRAGQRLVCLVVPEKLAVYADHFPENLTPNHPRPVLRLLDEGLLPLVYPLEALRDARTDGDTYLLTDSHLTLRGNLILAEATIKELGVPPALLHDTEDASRPHLGAGDLGRHFNPPIVEVMTSMTGASRATVVSDNWAEVSRVGGHIGTIRVFRREDARDGRTVVVFGDSYGFGDDAYQGLSWFLAQVFREVHFVWAPFGWDPDYLDSVGAELVVCQTAERFVGRIPRLRVDARSLAQDTIRQRRALTDEYIFED